MLARESHVITYHLTIAACEEQNLGQKVVKRHAATTLSSETIPTPRLRAIANHSLHMAPRHP